MIKLLFFTAVLVLADSAFAERIKIKTRTVFAPGDEVLLKDIQGNTISPATVVCEGTDCSFDVPEKLPPEKIKEIKRISKIKKEKKPIRHDWVASVGVGSLFFPSIRLGIALTDYDIEHHLYLTQNSSTQESFKISGQEISYIIKSWNLFEKKWLGYSGGVGLGKSQFQKPGIVTATVNYLYVPLAAEAKFALSDSWEIGAALGGSWNNIPKELIKGDPMTKINLGGFSPYMSADIRWLF